mgnify:CR=1 FL=1|tara:strand:- start:1266 stop:1682 length:417 start_codon:yes stop_codon:yes gene_type:complete
MSKKRIDEINNMRKLMGLTEQVQKVEKKTYSSLKEFVKNITNIVNNLDVQPTHMIIGTYFSAGGTNRVDIKLINISTSVIDVTKGADGKDSIETLLFNVLTELSKEITSEMKISGRQFPLPPNTEINGVTTSLKNLMG